jgi:hypothetical protein
MYNPDTELLFPQRVIPHLRNARGGENWNTFVDRLVSAECTRIERLAFVLIMVRMGGCASCSADSFRAMRGCTACARQTIKRYRGNDIELSELFQQTQKEIDLYLKKRTSS